MVQVTERAANALQELLIAEGAPPEAAIRLQDDGQGRLGMSVDAPQPGDEVVSRDDIPVLVVDGGVSERLADKVVDYQAPDGSQVRSGQGFMIMRAPE